MFPEKASHTSNRSKIYLITRAGISIKHVKNNIVSAKYKYFSGKINVYALIMNIKAALPSDASIFTQIAFAAKRHWDYPEHYFEIWKDELTINQAYIRDNIVFKYVYNGEITGFYSIVFNPKGFITGEVYIEKGYWLEHIFILPKHHRKGFGTEMISHLKEYSTKKFINEILIFVDPYAKGFYEKVGATFTYNSKSSIPKRSIPVYKIKV